MQDNHIFKSLTLLADETFHGDSPTFTHSWPHLQQFYDRVLSKTTFTTNGLLLLPRLLLLSGFLRDNLVIRGVLPQLRTQPHNPEYIHTETSFQKSK